MSDSADPLRFPCEIFPKVREALTDMLGGLERATGEALVLDPGKHRFLGIEFDAARRQPEREPAIASRFAF